ncbi:hypothetical protein S40285_07037 [Stachybotrys chlorohalonatus IBT 40285]|uniref:Uncharacterized protein n=1 Tax=Stachybotrys chlorohalonatus (strain IBT 40285) TaxID=1283841 RepID=A0A084QS52_STAC4|nr:hypothetical protein S40285_07037 [Stachybotrys chlorohalonata IBT 40285]
MKTVGIFPASGALGTSTLAHLLRLIPAPSLVLISRHPTKLGALPPGAQTRTASYESPPQHLESVFAGVDVLFLISYPSHVREYRVQVQLPAITSAHRAGVKHIFYSSLAFALPDGNASAAEVMGAHLDSEEQLRALAAADPGFTWTSMREGLYHESFPIYTAFFDLRNPVEEIRIPHDGGRPGVSWAKRDELGEATARLISQYLHSPGPFPWTNRIVALTGPREWSLAETVQTLADALGRPVRITPVSVDEYVAQPHVLAYFGSEEKARTWATAWQAIAAGEAAYVAPTLEEVLGRPPEPFDVTVRDMVKQLDLR